MRFRLQAVPLAALVVLTGGLVACGSGGSEATTRAASLPVDRGDCQRVGTLHGEPLRLCSEPNENDHGRFVRASGTSAREVAVSPPGRTPTATDAGKLGHWAWAALSPDGETILAQWSAACEVPIAFLVDADSGTPTPVTGEADWATSPESVALGWTTDARAIVFLPHGPACGSGVSRPGVYLYSEPGEGELLFPGKKTPIEGAKTPRSVAALRHIASGA